MASSSEETDGELWEETSSEDEKVEEEETETKSERASESFAKMLHADDVQSDEEVSRNTIGNVPLRWYDHLPHIGYDKSGKKIKRASKANAIDNAIRARDDPDFKWTIVDEYNGIERTLSERQLVLLQRIREGRAPHPEANMTPDYIPYFTNKVQIHPMTNNPTAKKNFVPSRHEELLVARLQKGIREGKIRIEKKKNKKDGEEDDLFLLWNDDGWNGKRRRGVQFRMPKMKLPSHAESYRPPDEYLPTEEEKQALEEKEEFVPTKFDSLRVVPGYKNFLKERFERCLDLYLCPAKIRRKAKQKVEPDSLVPNLPHPRELRPFPEEQMLLFQGHDGRVRSISVSPSGQWLVSCGEDKTVRRWETDTGRCTRVWKFEETPVSVAWNPNSLHHVVAVAVGDKVAILNMETSSGHASELTSNLLSSNKEEEEEEEEEEDEEKKNKSETIWTQRSKDRLDVVLTSAVRQVVWHSRGNYFATVCPSSSSPSKRVAVHILSKRRTQHPFRRVKGMAQCVAFHPSKPIFFLATKKNVRVYHLQRQQMITKLTSAAKHISSLAVHSSGDHVMIGTIDRRLCWFDLDLASTPFKSLQYHTKALRQALFHSRYPLMASASDDGTIHVFHAKVYSDVIQSPLIVPVKVLRGHSVKRGLGVLDIEFHPTQPWLFSAGADGTIRLFQNVH